MRLFRFLASSRYYWNGCKELVEQKLPNQYWKFKDVFSKAALNILPPYRPYNYKIEIDQGKESTLSFSPLYPQSIAEL